MQTQPQWSPGFSHPSLAISNGGTTATYSPRESDAITPLHVRAETPLEFSSSFVYLEYEIVGGPGMPAVSVGIADLDSCYSRKTSSNTGWRLTYNCSDHLVTYVSGYGTGAGRAPGLKTAVLSETTREAKYQEDYRVGFLFDCTRGTVIVIPNGFMTNAVSRKALDLLQGKSSELPGVRVDLYPCCTLAKPGVGVRLVGITGAEVSYDGVVVDPSWRRLGFKFHLPNFVSQPSEDTSRVYESKDLDKLVEGWLLYNALPDTYAAFQRSTEPGTGAGTGTSTGRSTNPELEDTTQVVDPAQQILLDSMTRRAQLRTLILNAQCLDALEFIDSWLGESLFEAQPSALHCLVKGHIDCLLSTGDRPAVLKFLMDSRWMKLVRHIHCSTIVGTGENWESTQTRREYMESLKSLEESVGNLVPIRSDPRPGGLESDLSESESPGHTSPEESLATPPSSNPWTICFMRVNRGIVSFLVGKELFVSSLESALRSFLAFKSRKWQNQQCYRGLRPILS